MADLTVTITESLNLYSTEVGCTRSKTISGINDYYKRIINCQNGQTTTAVVFAATEATTQTALDVGDARYVRVTNLDTTNTVEVAYVLISGEGEEAVNQNFHITVGPESTHVLFAAEQISFCELDAVPSFGTMIDLSKIMIRPVEAADVRCEIYIASA